MPASDLQIVKYGVVGAGVNLAGYALFLLLLSVGVGHKVAVSLLYPLGALASFWLNRKLVFQSRTTLPSSLFRLVLMLLGGYLLNIALLYCLVDLLGHDPRVIQVISFVLVALLFFIVNKLFVHRNSPG